MVLFVRRLRASRAIFMACRVSRARANCRSSSRRSLASALTCALALRRQPAAISGNSSTSRKKTSRSSFSTSTGRAARMVADQATGCINACSPTNPPRSSRAALLCPSGLLASITASPDSTRKAPSAGLRSSTRVSPASNARCVPVKARTSRRTGSTPSNRGVAAKRETASRKLMEQKIGTSEARVEAHSPSKTLAAFPKPPKRLSVERDVHEDGL